MKSFSHLLPKTTIDNSRDKSFASFSSSRTIDVKDQITDKFRTFANWNYRKEVQQRRKSKGEFLTKGETTDANNMMNALLMFTQSLQKQKEDKEKKSKGKNKNVLQIEELEGVKAERRERFKKVQNPMQIIQHYMNKEAFSPSEEQNILLERIVKLKEFLDQNQPMDLELTLEKIYKIMNIAVDLNEMNFLILVVLMAAEICFESKEFIRSFHFYTQAMIATTCARMNTIKIECFVQMGKIAMEIMEYEKALIFFKKALQYSWKVKETEEELKLYDLIGQVFYYQGQANYGLYYHNRYIQGELQKPDSAVRRISYEMMAEFQESLENKEVENLSELFIQYLTLPITNFNSYPATKVKKPYANYSNSESPRKNIDHSNFGANNLPSVTAQMNRIVKELLEFKTELPNPDLQKNFIANKKYGRPRKQVDFEQSNQYHKIVGISLKKCDPSAYKLPMSERIEKLLGEKQNPNWWSDMITKTKKERQQRLGQLRSKVQKTHLSYHKYPEERRRSNSVKNERINRSLNKTLLNWIDPTKEQFL